MVTNRESFVAESDNEDQTRSFFFILREPVDIFFCTQRPVRRSGLGRSCGADAEPPLQKNGKTKLGKRY